jgi:hypothetical protein
MKCNHPLNKGESGIKVNLFRKEVLFLFPNSGTLSLQLSKNAIIIFVKMIMLIVEHGLDIFFNFFRLRFFNNDSLDLAQAIGSDLIEIVHLWMKLVL